MKSRIKTWLSLLLTFMKIGGFTFGGGYAMIPLIQRETVENKKWITDEDILEVVAIAESTPGPIAINAATFIGYKVGGFFGAFFATLGVVIPSFAIILLISYALREFQEYRAVRYAFEGIRAGVLALIIKALFGMYKKCKKGLWAYIIMALAFVLSAFLDVPVYFIIIGSAAIGLVTSLFAKGRADK